MLKEFEERALKSKLLANLTVIMLCRCAYFRELLQKTSVVLVILL